MASAGLRLALLLAVLPACAASATSPPPPPGGTVPILQRWVIRHCGITEPGHAVLRSPEAWDGYWRAMHRMQLSPPNAPDVDFSQRMVLAVSQGQKTTGGWVFGIREVRRGPQALIIELHDTPPPDGAMTTLAMSAACEAVVIEASDLPVTVQPSR